MNPNVVFYYVAVGRHCVRECKLSVHSLRKIGKYTGKVFVVTDRAPDEQTERLGVSLIRRQVKGHCASPLKFKCFELLKDLVDPDTVVFYLDADFLTVARVDVPAILACCELDKVNVCEYPQRTQNHRNMAGGITSRPEILVQKAFCAGVFVVSMSNQAVRPTFEKIFDGYMKNPRHGKEQPLFCYHLLDRQQVKFGLHRFVDEYRELVERKRKKIKRSAVFMNFCGGASRGFAHNTTERGRAMQRVLRGLSSKS